VKLHHLGIACSNIRETADELGKHFSIISVSGIITDPIQNAQLCMVHVEGSVPFELIAGHVVRNFVKKNISLYHTCWEVSDLDKELVTMSSRGCYLISEPKPAVLFDLRRVAFLATPIGVVELLECSKDVTGQQSEGVVTEAGEMQLF
jgi:methylmalonyl-CoA/ethylmalonyl-CoA epimerase